MVLFAGAQNVCLTLKLAHLTQLHGVLRQTVQNVDRLLIDLRLEQVRLVLFFLHDGALQVLIPSLFVLDLVLHELLVGADGLHAPAFHELLGERHRRQLDGVLFLKSVFLCLRTLYFSHPLEVIFV